MHVVSPEEWGNVDADGKLHERLAAVVDSRPDVARAASSATAELCIAFERWQFRSASAVEDYLSDAWLGQHLEKLYVVNQDDIARGFLAGCYVSLRPGLLDRRLHVPCGYAWTYNAATVGACSSGQPSLLFSFRGTDASHPVRRRMAACLLEEPRGRVTIQRQPFHTHDEAQKAVFVEEALDSHFVLCPRGWSPCTYRLFEAMSLGRCPVIISDDWIPIPGVDWDACSLRVPEAAIRHLPAILREREPEAAALGRAAAAAWRANFSEARRFHGFLDAVLALDARRPAATRSPQFQRRRWRSWGFHWKNGWTAPQRAARLVRAVGSYARRSRA